jgi:hypothetical protein
MKAVRWVNGFCGVATLVLALPILALAFVIWMGTRFCAGLTRRWASRQPERDDRVV